MGNEKTPTLRCITAEPLYLFLVDSSLTARRGMKPSAGPLPSHMFQW